MKLNLKIFSLIIFIIVLILISGYIFTNDEDSSSLILTIFNESNETINVSVNISDQNDKNIFQELIHLERNNTYKSGKIIKKEGFYKISVSIDDNRSLYKEFKLNENNGPPIIIIKSDYIEFHQKKV